MEQEEILTKSQDRRLKAKALAALKKLATAPEVKDMIREVELGGYPDRGQGGSWGCLSLTKRGLVEQTGYLDRCVMPSDCNGMHQDREDDPRVVKPSMRLVEEYNLTGPQLNNLLAKLKA